MSDTATATATATVLAGIAEVAERVLPMIDAKRGSAAASALKALRQLVEDASALATGPDDVATLEALRRKVSTHCDETLARLGSAG